MISWRGIDDRNKYHVSSQYVSTSVDAPLPVRHRSEWSLIDLSDELGDDMANETPLKECDCEGMGNSFELAVDGWNGVPYNTIVA